MKKHQFLILIVLLFVAMLGIAGSTNFIDTGIKAANSGNYNSATINLYQALSVSSEGTYDYNMVTYYLVKSYFTIGDYSTAQKYINVLKNYYPEGEWVDGALYYQMRIALNNSDFGQLSTTFVQLTTAYPQAKVMGSAYLRYAEGLRNINNDYSGCIQYCNIIVHNFSGDFVVPIALLKLAVTYYNYPGMDTTTQLANCDNYLNQVVTQYPQSTSAPSAQYMKGYIREYGYKNYPSAIAEYLKVLNTWPNDVNAPTALFEIAKCYEALGDKTNAGSTYKQFITQYPNHNWTLQAKQSLNSLGRKD